MELGNGTETKTHNGDEATDTSGQIVMSKSVAKVAPAGCGATVPPASSVCGKDNEKNLVVKSEPSKDALIESTSDTHGSSDAWQPLNPVLGDNLPDTSNTNDNKVSVTEVVSPPMDTPSTALQNLDDFKKKQSEPCTKGNGSLGGKQGSEKGFMNQAVTPSRPSIDGDSEDANRKRKDKEAKFNLGKDFFCWICHKDKANVSCSKCPRSFHPKCLLSSGFHHSSLSGGARRTSSSSSSSHDITCPECRSIEDLERRPPRALKTVSKEELNSLLVYVIDSVKPVSILGQIRSVVT